MVEEVVMPVSSDAARYYGYWGPWLVVACIWATVMVVMASVGLTLLWKILQRL